jgi:hypothetical protein
VSWDSSTATAGSHALTAIARDSAGNTATSASITITVTAASGTLVAAYAYDEGSGASAADTSPSSNTATIAGATWSSVCRFGSCLAFDGTSSIVEAPDVDALTPGAQATFEAWVSLSAAPTETATVLNKWSQTIDDEYLLGVAPDLTLFFAWQTTGGGAWGSRSFNAANSVGMIPLNALTHIAVVRNGATLTFYINGTPEAPLNVLDTNPFRNGINTLRVGAQNRGGQARFWNGLIDEVRIDNRALDQTGIQNDLNTPIGPAPPDTTPPVISAVTASSITSSDATIGWATNEAGDSQVDYGPTTAYGTSSARDTNGVTAHSVALSGLVDNTLYHYRVRSQDAAGNLATSGDFTFTTAAAGAPAQVVLAWDANTESNLAGYKVYIGDSSGVYGTAIDAGNVTTYTVTGLQSGHHYYFTVTAYDLDGIESAHSNEVNTTP